MEIGLAWRKEHLVNIHRTGLPGKRKALSLIPGTEREREHACDQQRQRRAWWGSAAARMQSREGLHVRKMAQPRYVPWTVRMDCRGMEGAHRSPSKEPGSVGQGGTWRPRGRAQSPARISRGVSRELGADGLCSDRDLSSQGPGRLCEQGLRSPAGPGDEERETCLFLSTPQTTALAYPAPFSWLR